MNTAQAFYLNFMRCYKLCSEGLLLYCKIKPNSKNNEITAIEQDPELNISRLKIKIASPACEGQANKALIKYLSKYFKIPKSSIAIKIGHNSSFKQISLKLSAEEKDYILQQLATLSLHFNSL